MEEQEITLPQAALRLGRTWHATQKLALRGELGPARQVAGRWLVSAAGVEAYLTRRQFPLSGIADGMPS